MTVYEISSETLRKFRRRFPVTAVVLICGWLFLLHRFLRIPGHDKMYEATSNLVILGGCLAIWVGYGFLRLHEAAHGFGTIKISEDWIELPGRGKIRFSEISSVEIRESYDHPKFVLKLKKKSRLRGQVSVAVDPSQYSDVQGLTAHISRLLG